MNSSYFILDIFIYTYFLLGDLLVVVAFNSNIIIFFALNLYFFLLFSITFNASNDEEFNGINIQNNLMYYVQ